MRTFTHHALACLVWFMGLPLLIAQPVDLGTASSFAVFTATGAFSNDGNTVVTGDIGTNVGAFTGFPPGIVIGQIHVADVVSAQAATDVSLAYGMLASLTCGEVLGTTLGGGQILAPNIYCTGAATVIDGDLILDGECDPDAVFIFQIDGALSTTSLSTITLINSASLCNIYWQVNGAVSLGPESVFRGNIVAGGAISMLEGADLEGRALTTAGAIDMHNNIVDMNMLPAASILVAEGVVEFCEGGSVVLSGNCGGTWSNGESTSTITVSESGDYFVTTENECGIAISNHIIVVVHPLPVCAISGDLSLCLGESTELCAGIGFASYLWSTGEVTACITTSVAGLYSATITDAFGCTSNCNVTVEVNPLPLCSISGGLEICEGESTELCAGIGFSSYLWSTGEITACITVDVEGLYSVTVTDALGCTSSCNVTIDVSIPPICTITGTLALCEGESTELCAGIGFSSYLWSTGEITACITVDVEGLYSVTVTDALGCTSSCNVTIAISTPPICTITGALALCEGASTELCAGLGFSSYLWSTGEITACITVDVEGMYAVTVTDALGCTSSCNVTIAISTPPICGIL